MWREVLNWRHRRRFWRSERHNEGFRCSFFRAYTVSTMALWKPDFSVERAVIQGFLIEYTNDKSPLAKKNSGNFGKGFYTMKRPIFLPWKKIEGEKRIYLRGGNIPAGTHRPSVDDDDDDVTHFSLPAALLYHIFTLACNFFSHRVRVHLATNRVTRARRVSLKSSRGEKERGRGRATFLF